MIEWWGEFPHLHQKLSGLRILSEVPSTNDFLRGKELPDYAAVMTNHQTAGRGRLGRTWVSRPGQGLAFSFIVPKLSPRRRQWLPLIVGANLVSLTRALGVDGAELKWPNDVLVYERKLAGILCEVRTDGRVIVGIGINIDFAGGEAASPGAISLAECAQVSQSLVDILLANLVTSVRIFCGALEQEDLSEARDIVNRVLATLGREVSVHEVQGTKWRGLALSLTNDGHLLVRESVTGGERVVVASDVRHLRQ